MYCSSEPDSGRLVTTRHGGTLATVGAGPFTTHAISLAPLAITDRRMEYCLQLAARNMTPYLQQRRQSFDETRWRNFAPQADFFLIVCQPTDDAMSAEQTAGFLSVRDEPDCPNALHIGDIQLEAALGNDAGTMGDPKLTLFGYNALGSKWVSLAANDNISSKNANARLNFIPGYTGDYYLEATGATYGTYRLSVTADRTGQSEDGPERDRHDERLERAVHSDSSPMPLHAGATVPGSVARRVLRTSVGRAEHEP